MDGIKLKLRQTLTFIALMLLSLIALMLGLQFFPVDDGVSVGMLKLLQLLQSALVFIVPALLWSKIFTGTMFEGLWLQNRPKTKDVCLVVLLMIVAVPAINFLGWLNSQISLPAFMEETEQWMQQLERQAEEMTFKLLSGTDVTDLLVNLLVIALVPAIGEEMTFRGVLMHIFTNKTTPAIDKPFTTVSMSDSTNGRAYYHISIWVCAIIFSFIHFQFYGFFPRMFIGALFGYLLFYSGSLWLPVAAHFTNNAIVVLTTYIYQVSTGKPLEEMQDLGTASTWWVGLVSLVVAFCGFYLLLRPKKKNLVK